MCGALCCSQSATAPLCPLQMYSTVDGLFTDSIFEVKAVGGSSLKGKTKTSQIIRKYFLPLKLSLPLNPPGDV